MSPSGPQSPKTFLGPILALRDGPRRLAEALNEALRVRVADIRGEWEYQLSTVEKDLLVRLVQEQGPCWRDFHEVELSLNSAACRIASRGISK